MSDEFDWSEAEQAGLVIVKPQVAVAVYLNPDGDAVIRNGVDAYLDDESFVIIPRDKIVVVADALKNLYAEG